MHNLNGKNLLKGILKAHKGYCLPCADIDYPDTTSTLLNWQFSN
jgi:hypothetical protein